MRVKARVCGACGRILAVTATCPCGNDPTKKKPA